MRPAHAKKRRLVWAMALAFILVSTCSGMIVYCIRAVDGDTLAVTDGVTEDRVRLIGVDTPETKHPRKPKEPYGEEASRFTASVVGSYWILLEFDGNPKRDRYGRLLAYVWVHTFLLNAELIRWGYGRAYTRYPFLYRDFFVELEKEAREHGRGLWMPFAPVKKDSDEVQQNETKDLDEIPSRSE